MVVGHPVTGDKMDHNQIILTVEEILLYDGKPLPEWRMNIIKCEPILTTIVEELGNTPSLFEARFNALDIGKHNLIHIETILITDVDEYNICQVHITANRTIITVSYALGGPRIRSYNFDWMEKRCEHIMFELNNPTSIDELVKLIVDLYHRPHISRSLYNSRKRAGWSKEEILHTPVGSRCRFLTNR